MCPYVTNYSEHFVVHCNSNCTPTKPVPILHIHAKDDTHVLFNGGAGPEAFEGQENAVTSFTSVAKSLDKWMRVNRSGV